MIRGFGLIAAALIAVAPATAAAQDWSHTVSTTAAGGYVLGNPAAKVKLVEYLSFTCSHCAHFAQEAMPALTANYVKTGLVSIEARHALRDPADFAAALLARCAGPSHYFAAAGRIFAGQEKWFPALTAYEKANEAKLKAMPRDTLLVSLANGARLPALAGIAPARVKTCIASKTEQEQLGKMANEAWGERKIQGTPSFLLNGTLLADTASWEALKPKIDAALK